MLSTKKKKLAYALYILCFLKTHKKESKRNIKKRSVWVRDWLKKRSTDGGYETPIREIDNQHFLFENFIRMDDDSFNELLELVSPYICKQDTNMRKAIAVRERLATTLRFLATGDSYKSLSTYYRIAPNTISLFIPVVCDAIYKALKDLYLKIPSTNEEWNKVAIKFNKLWNFPNCLGAVGGKHVHMAASPKLGNTINYYEDTRSIVLMAVVDAEYNFLYVDVGCNGRVPDGEVFENCSFQSALERNDLNVPRPKPLPGRQANVPFVLVADDAFRMQQHLLIPFSSKCLSRGQRIFNYRLSRARHIVDNAFGIMSKRFEIFYSFSRLNVEKTVTIALACCTLHNFLLRKKNYAPTELIDQYDDNGAVIPGTWRNDVPLLAENKIKYMPVSHMSKEAKANREEFEKYFMSENGELYWQYKHI